MTAAESFDLGIRCGHLLTMRGGRAEVLTDHFLGLRGSRIARVAPWASQRAAKFIDAQTKVVLPGLVNAHTHLPMSLFRGLADDLPFMEWFHEYILPLEARLVSPEFVRLGTELSALESLLRGTTSVCEMFYFDDEIADVVDRAGLRGLIGETVIDFPVPDNKLKDGGDYRVLDRLVEKYRGHERIIPAIAPHAPNTCSDDTLRQALAYAEKYDLPVHIHVSETLAEIQDSRQRYGKSPVQRLNDLGLFERHALLAHCVHLSDADFATLAAAPRTSCVYNAESNMKLGSGTAPIVRLLKEGVNVALGTDGPASNNDLNLFKEMDSAAKLQKLIHADNTAMTAEMALRLATVGGARAMGLGGDLGTLEEGKLADLVVFDLEQPQHKPLHNVASQLVYASTGSEVETVIVHGKVVVEKGRALFIDAEDLYARLAAYRARVNL